MNIDILGTRSQTGIRSTARTAVRVLGLLLALVALFFVARRAGAYLPQFAEWVDGLGFWGPLVFIVGYAIATVAFVPGSLLTLAAGAIFGLVPGTAYVFVAALAAGVDTERDWTYYTTLVVGLLATLGVTTVLGRLARKALREVTDE